MQVTVFLGSFFLCCQAVEYYLSPFTFQSTLINSMLLIKAYRTKKIYTCGRVGVSQRLIMTESTHKNKFSNKRRFFMILVLIFQFVVMYFVLNEFAGVYVRSFAEGRIGFHLQDMENALLWFHNELSVNTHYLWNILVGASLSRCLYFTFLGFHFFRRDINTLSNEDNVWLSKFIEEHPLSKDDFKVLDYHKGFSNWCLMNKQLFRIILVKIYFYCLPLTLNLIYFKDFYWQYYVVGFLLMSYYQSLRNLVFLIYVMCCELFLVVYNFSDVDILPTSYKNNYMQYTAIVLKVSIYYNCFPLIFFGAVNAFGTLYWVQFLSVFVVGFYLATLAILCTYIVLGLSFYLLELLVFHLTGYDLYKLSLQDKVLKKSKLFFLFCVLMIILVVF